MKTDNVVHMYPHLFPPHDSILCRELPILCPYHGEMAFCMTSHSRNTYLFEENKRNIINNEPYKERFV